MSTQFRFPPSTLKHDDLKPFEAITAAIGVGPKLKKNCNNSVVSKSSSTPLRDGHIVLLAVDVLVALHASLKKWRNHRRTLCALADLDECQLRDIGLTRDEALLGKSYRALAELDENRRQSP